MTNKTLTPEEQTIFDLAFAQGVEEGITIERLRVNGLVDDYIDNPDVDLDLLLEWINEE